MSFKVTYRKAMPGVKGCDKCDHHIGVVVDGSYICNHCGYKHRPKKEEVTGCTCWIGCCHIHV